VPSRRYDLEAATLTRGSDGVWRLGPWARVVTWTAGGTFAISSASGQTRVVRARTWTIGEDQTWTLAGPWGGMVGVSTPFNDVDPALRFSPGWRRVGAYGRWQGGLHYTSTAGRSMALSAEASKITLIGERCWTCGRFLVQVDGRDAAVIDTFRQATLVRPTTWL
jgi:hypothetical protein